MECLRVVNATIALPSCSQAPLCGSSGSAASVDPPPFRSSVLGTACNGLVWRSQGTRLFSRTPGLHGRIVRVNGGGVATAYLERDMNPVEQFFKKVQGALPIVGLISRIMSDEGGVGTDRIQFVEFCGRVEKNCSQDASRAFYDFAERHGKVAKPQYVLIWCWAAALGAGLLKSDDMLMGAARLRCSYDIQYEIESFDVLMEEAAKKRAKSNSPGFNIPMEARAEKALDAICTCCIGASQIAEEDVLLLTTILSLVFPSANGSEIENIVRSRLLNAVDDVSILEQASDDLDRKESEVVQDTADSLV